MSEQWKRVIGHEDQYEVSNHGRVRKCVTTYVTRRSGITEIKPYMCKMFLDSKGIPCVHIGDGKSGKTCQIKRLVAEAFIGIKERRMQIIMIDGDNNNIRPGNIKYVTRSEAMQMAKFKKKHGEPLGDTYRKERANQMQRAPTNSALSNDRAAQEIPCRMPSQPGTLYSISSAMLKHPRMITEGGHTNPYGQEKMLHKIKGQ